MRLTFVSHDAVGDMVVGRVMVAVNMYDIVPRSNFDSGQQPLAHESSNTYIDTARQSFRRKFKLKVEVIDTFGESSLSAKNYLILEEGYEPIAKIAARLLAFA